MIGRKSEIAGSSPSLAFKFQRHKMFLPLSLVKIQYCGELPWPRGSVLDLRPQGPRNSGPVSVGHCHPIHFTILRRFSRPSLAYLCAQRWPKTFFISIHFTCVIYDRVLVKILHTNTLFVSTASPLFACLAHLTLSVRRATLDVRFWRLKSILALKTAWLPTHQLLQRPTRNVRRFLCYKVRLW